MTSQISGLCCDSDIEPDQYKSFVNFCLFLSRCCSTATWNFLISRARSMEYLNSIQKFSLIFLFLYFDTVRSDPAPGNFANI